MIGIYDCFGYGIGYDLPNDEYPINNIGIKRLENIISEAEKKDIQIAFENLNNIRNMALVLRIFQSKNVEFVKITALIPYLERLSELQEKEFLVQLKKRTGENYRTCENAHVR